MSAALRFIIIFALLTSTLDTALPAHTRWLDALTTLFFAPVGVLQILIAWRRITLAWPKYVLITIDVVALTVAVFLPWDGPMTGGFPALITDQALVIYSFVLLMLTTLYLSAWAILWFAAASLVFWSLAFVALLSLPGVVTEEAMPAGLDAAAQLDFRMQPGFMDVDRIAEELSLLLIVSLGTAAIVARARAVFLRSAATERRRGNLARYFSPAVLDELEDRDGSLKEGRPSDAAILFADLRDFTAMTQNLPPAAVLALLRQFHGAMEEQVFAYRGVLEKYIGDALVASFGALKSRNHDAAHALCCAHAMFAALATVNLRREADGRPPIAMGIGLHFGPIVAADIGSERSMAFTIVGGAVNMASRIQGLTRTLGSDIVMSLAFETQLRGEVGASADLMLSGFSDPAPAQVKGFADPVWVRPRRAAPPALRTLRQNPEIDDGKGCLLRPRTTLRVEERRPYRDALEEVQDHSRYFNGIEIWRKHPAFHALAKDRVERANQPLPVHIEPISRLRVSHGFGGNLGCEDRVDRLRGEVDVGLGEALERGFWPFRIP